MRLRPMQAFLLLAPACAQQSGAASPVDWRQTASEVRQCAPVPSELALAVQEIFQSDGYQARMAKLQKLTERHAVAAVWCAVRALANGGLASAQSDGDQARRRAAEFVRDQSGSQSAP